MKKPVEAWWEILFAWVCLISTAVLVFVVFNPLVWIFMVCLAILLQVMK